MNLETSYPEPHPQTAGRVFDGEAVLVLSDSAEINVLNGVGSRVFELADGARSLAAIVDTIVDEYDVDHTQATTDVLEFVNNLVANQVLVVATR